MCSVITRIWLIGMPSTSLRVPRTMNGAWVELQTVSLPPDSGRQMQTYGSMNAGTCREVT